MPGLTALIEEAIRYPGFAFVNIQSPCVTFGEDEQQLKAHKANMKPLASLGHDPSDQLAALDLARAYGKALHTGVFYRNPNPPPTYESLVKRARPSRPSPRGPPAHVSSTRICRSEACDERNSLPTQGIDFASAR
jgi:pyruvate/2-oxoacid:ferredoxin oxidoreductase beta subunit